MAKTGYTRRFPGQNRVPYKNITLAIPTTHPILATYPSIEYRFKRGYPIVATADY